jgi:hypothetical protein
VVEHLLSRHKTLGSEERGGGREGGGGGGRRRERGREGRRNYKWYTHKSFLGVEISPSL